MSGSRDSSGREGYQTRTRAHRGGGLDPRAGPPGRERSIAETNYRRGWAGLGGASQVEKNAVGRFITDSYRVLGEVAVLTLPTLWYLRYAAANAPVGIFNTWILASAAMASVGTLVRGGWVHPLWTSAPGWVRLFPKLVALRLVYFNLMLVAAMQGGLVVATLTETGAAGLLFAAAVGALTALLFPRVADEAMARFR